MLLKRMAALASAAILLPALAFAGGEDDPGGAPPPKRAAKKAAPKDPCATAPNWGPYGRIPFSKPVDDRKQMNEHAHPLEGTYFPPESHHYIDLDTAPNDLLNRNVRILRTTNKAQLNRYVPKVYTFKNVNPFAVLRFMRRPIQMEEGAIFTFVAPDAKSGKVLIAVPEYQLCYMDQIAARIDRADLTSSDGTTRIYRQLKHRRASYSGGSDLEDMAFIDQFAIYLTGNSHTIIVDSEQNAVWFEDTPSGAEYLDKALTEKLDKPTPQVSLNTKIYELSLVNNSRIGLDYIAWKNGPGADLFAFGTFAEHGRINVDNGSMSTGTGSGVSNLSLPRSSFEVTGTNFAYRYEVPSAYFDYLATRGKAKILNSAKLVALNTRTARINVGDQLLYYPVQTTNPSGIRDRGEPFEANEGRTVIGTVNEKPYYYSSLTPVETGLQVELTPLIYENGVDVDIEGELTDYTGFNDDGSPNLNSREFETHVRMAAGEEIILGGLARETAVKATNKVPVLGSLPIIGYLFGGENTRRTQSELVVALQAEQIDRFDGKGQAVPTADKAIIDQAEGTADINTPATTWGFDQFLLDDSKASYNDPSAGYKGGK